MNWAIDRRALINQGGFGSGDRLVQILPPGMPGYKTCNGPCYPINVTAATVKKAQALAKGHTGDGKAILYTSNRGAAPLQAQIYQFNLKQIGLDVEVQQYARAVQIEKEGDPRRRVRLHDRGLGRRLRRPVRLHQRAAVR